MALVAGAPFFFFSSLPLLKSCMSYQKLSQASAPHSSSYLVQCKSTPLYYIRTYLPEKSSVLPYIARHCYILAHMATVKFVSGWSEGCCLLKVLLYYRTVKNKILECRHTYVLQAVESSIVDGSGTASEHDQGEEVGEDPDQNHNG